MLLNKCFSIYNESVFLQLPEKLFDCSRYDISNRLTINFSNHLSVTVVVVKKDIERASGEARSEIQISIYLNQKPDLRFSNFVISSSIILS